MFCRFVPRELALRLPLDSSKLFQDHFGGLWTGPQIRHLSALRKRFYKEVTVTENDNKFELNLDGRKLKTPSGSVLQVKSYPLALAVATEWRSQREYIRPAGMHLTALSNTTVDNPMKCTPQSLALEINDFMQTDTLCFRSSEPEDLAELQAKSWESHTEWFKMRYDCELNVTENIFTSGVPEETSTKVKRHLESRTLASVFGLQFIVENLKSVILALALSEKRISVEEAVALSRLETEFQIAKWGRVEWAHDIDIMQTRARVAAGLLFYFLNSESTMVKRKTASSH